MEGQIRAIEEQTKALERQIEQAAEWRDAEMARLDALLEDAKKRMEIALGTYIELVSIDDAVRALNTSINNFLGLKGVDSMLVPVKPPVLVEIVDSTGPSYAEAAQRAAEATDGLKAEIVSLRKDMAAASTAQVIPIKEMATRLQKWDLDGLPESSASSGTALRVA